MCLQIRSLHRMADFLVSGCGGDIGKWSWFCYADYGVFSCVCEGEKKWVCDGASESAHSRACDCALSGL